ncbi:hypothetical protein FACS1894103_3170 [Campylobacterota bacterium]|nr:hypothetical protein FACS1894103_3170 [Campylobacterota bacterium]
MSADAVLLSLSLWVLLLTALFSLSACGSSDSSSSDGGPGYEYCPNRNNPVTITPAFASGDTQLTISLESSGLDFKSYLGLNMPLRLSDGVGSPQAFPNTFTIGTRPSNVTSGDKIECVVKSDGQGSVQCKQKYAYANELYPPIEGWNSSGTLNLTDGGVYELRIYVNSTESTSGSVGAACGYYSIGVSQADKKFIKSSVDYTPETSGSHYGWK